MALAKALGATVNLAFAPHDPFDYCVANTVNSTKYLLARARASRGDDWVATRQRRVG